MRAKEGYHGVTTGEIAKRAKIAEGTIFRYHSSKSALANAVFNRCFERYLGFVPKEWSTDDTREQFGTIWNIFVKMFKTYPDDFIFYEIHFHGSFLGKAGRQQKEHLRKLTKDWIVSSQKKGALIKADPELVLAIMIGMFTRLIRESLDQTIKITTKSLSEAETLCWNSISARR